MTFRLSAKLPLLLAALVPPAALATRWPACGALVFALDLLAVALLVLDRRRAESAAGASVRRFVSEGSGSEASEQPREAVTLPARATSGRPFELTLEVTNPGQSPLAVRIDERLPRGFEPREASITFTVPAGARARRSRRVVAMRRGRYPLLPPAGARASPWGLAWLPLRGEGPSELSVLPQLARPPGHEALLRQRRLRELGIVRARERGEGTEIAGLRPYVAGDPFGGIDWKATARRGAPISRERQAERRQDVIILLDAGRRMARESQAVRGPPQSRLDRAIEAALLLGQVALSGDDRVGLFAFADEIVRALAPGRGPAQVGRLARALEALEPLPREPPYAAIAAQVATRTPRRALMVLLTEVAEPSSALALVGPVRLLARHHLVLCAVFRDASVEAALREPPRDGAALYRAGAAAELAQERERGLGELRRAGALVIEASGANLPTTLVNEYLRIKARRLL